VNNTSDIQNVIVKLKLFSEDLIMNPGDKYKIYSTNNGISGNAKTISDCGAAV
jgi:hypothetical protein